MTGVTRARLLLASALAALCVGGVTAPTTAHAASMCGTPAGAYPWCDTGMSADQRAGLLLSALTGDEKISLLAGIASTAHTGQTQNIDRVGLRSVNITDDGVGVKSGASTALPIPLAIAATFDTGMAATAGATIADETKAKGDDIILGPTVNIMRTPLGGRTFEAYGEDPYLVSRTAVSWIESAQSQGVMAEVKHFCCNNEEGAATAVCEKNFCSSDLDERTLREIYTPQFEAAVKEANAAAVMCAYNRVNDDWACEHQHLLSGILKGEWAFPGIVMSDWQSQHFTVMALKNGLDVEMPTASDYSAANVNAALTAGLVTWSDIDDHVRRFLRMLFAFGFFDRAPYVADDGQIDVPAHDQVSQQIEESGMTLLQNSGILPLSTSSLKSVALIGAQADRFENGANTENITPFTYSTPRQAITQRAGPGVTVSYDDGSSITTAMAAASAANVAVVFASDHEGEYNDKVTPSVDGSNGSTSTQDALIQAVATANPNTIVVLETGDPVLTPWRSSVKAVVEAWYPGQEGGKALARVLFGDVDPGGRLPVTFPASATAYPTAGDPSAYPGVGTDVLYTEGVFVGYRWYDQNNVTPAFPFGYGLSYTTFSYHDLAIQQAAPGSGAVATVSVKVTNTGSRSGSAVPQLYLGLPSPSLTVLQPPRQLRGYSKLSLAPGETQTVSFPLDNRAFSYWDVTSNGWVVAPGCYGVMAGSSSRDLPLQGTIARGGAACGAGSVVISDVPATAVAEAPGAGLLATLGALAIGTPTLLARRRRRRTVPKGTAG